MENKYLYLVLLFIAIVWLGVALTYCIIGFIHEVEGTRNTADDYLDSSTDAEGAVDNASALMAWLGLIASAASAGAVAAAAYGVYNSWKA
jgi:hypothetical protein